MSAESKHYLTNLRAAFLVLCPHTHPDLVIPLDFRLYAYSPIGVLAESLSDEERQAPSNSRLICVRIDPAGGSILLTPAGLDEELARICNTAPRFLHDTEPHGDLSGFPSRYTDGEPFALCVPGVGFWIMELQMIRMVRITREEDGDMPSTVEYLVEREKTHGAVEGPNSGVFLKSCHGIRDWTGFTRAMARKLNTQTDMSWMTNG